MPCLAQEYGHPKLPATTNHYCKSLSSLVRETYAHCHVPCVRSPAAGWSSGDDTDDDDDDSFLDTKQVVLNEMRNRQMKKRSRCSVDSQTPSSPFVWSPFTPLDPRSVLEKVSTPKKCVMKEEEEEEEEKGEDGDDDEEAGRDDESEAFFSVKSFFSRSTSRGATVASSFAVDPPPPLQSPATWEGFRDCQGWPFGLCRRHAVLPLPPLPSTPADPWKWRNRSSTLTASPAPAYIYKTTGSS
ncbi:hypothetical protein GUJ93_ZPchr0002g26123 [Zizania palustris]|uniref:Uncharacterized protein n=1 Tax=Zizania palustris TaxID=103762 RepID=A0A8J5VEP1_ZIZPA|nr:hypothetical protein GUJ93_ZPchr0002g26123 [Zizania palustris]